MRDVDLPARLVERIAVRTSRLARAATILLACGIGPGCLRNNRSPPSFVHRRVAAHLVMPRTIQVELLEREEGGHRHGLRRARGCRIGGGCAGVTWTSGTHAGLRLPRRAADRRLRASTCRWHRWSKASCASGPASGLRGTRRGGHLSGDCGVLNRDALPAGELPARADDTISEEFIVGGDATVRTRESAPYESETSSSNAAEKRAPLLTRRAHPRPLAGTEADEAPLRLTALAARWRQLSGAARTSSIFRSSGSSTAGSERASPSPTRRAERAEAFLCEREVQVAHGIAQARAVGAAIVDDAVEQIADLTAMGRRYKKRFGGAWDAGRTVRYVMRNSDRAGLVPARRDRGPGRYAMSTIIVGPRTGGS